MILQRAANKIVQKVAKGYFYIFLKKKKKKKEKKEKEEKKKRCTAQEIDWSF